EYKIGEFDKEILESEGQIGIEEVRNLQKKVFLAPRGKTKGVVFKNAHTLTIAAQNALLKLLEEPPQNTILVLEVSSKDLLLPTILSRCTILVIQDKRALEKGSTTVLNLNSAKRMELAESVSKTREEALSFLEKEILGLRSELLQKHTSELAKVVKEFQKTHTVISSTNTNVRLVVENLLLNL